MTDLKLIQRRVFCDETLCVVVLAKEPNQPTTCMVAPHSDLHFLTVGLPADGDYTFDQYPVTARVLLNKQNFAVIDTLRAQYMVVGCYNERDALLYTHTVMLKMKTREDGGAVETQLYIDDAQVKIEHYPSLIDAMNQHGCYPGVRYGMVMIPGVYRIRPTDLVDAQRHWQNEHE